MYILPRALQDLAFSEYLLRYVTHDTSYDRVIKVLSNGDMVDFVILVTIQRQFINVQYRDA